MDKQYNMIYLKYGNVRIGLAEDIITMLEDEIEYYVSMAHNIQDAELLREWLSRAYDDREQIKNRFKLNDLIKFEIDEDFNTTFEVIGKINKNDLK